MFRNALAPSSLFGLKDVALPDKYIWYNLTLFFFSFCRFPSSCASPHCKYLPSLTECIARNRAETLHTERCPMFLLVAVSGSWVVHFRNVSLVTFTMCSLYFSKRERHNSTTHIQASYNNSSRCFPYVLVTLQKTLAQHRDAKCLIFSKLSRWHCTP